MRRAAVAAAWRKPSHCVGRKENSALAPTPALCAVTFSHPWHHSLLDCVRRAPMTCPYLSPEMPPCTGTAAGDGGCRPGWVRRVCLFGCRIRGTLREYGRSTSLACGPSCYKCNVRQLRPLMRTMTTSRSALANRAQTRKLINSKTHAFIRGTRYLVKVPALSPRYPWRRRGGPLD